MSAQRETALAEIYSKTVFRYGQVAAGDPQLAFILEHLPADLEARVLDAGCGGGRYAQALAGLGYSKILGVDLFDRVDTQGRFEYRQAGVDRTGCQDCSMDFVYSCSVIYHLEDPGIALREIARVLKPGAKLVATVHSKWSWFTLHNLIRMMRGKPDATHLRHARFLAPWTYRRLIHQAGLELIEVDGFRVSFLLYPIYFRVALRVKRYLGIQLPLAQGGPSRFAPLRWYRSVFAYHTVLVARKPSSP